MKKDAPALILVDIQKGLAELDFYGGERNNPEAETNARTLLEHWREKEWPLFHIRHCSVTPGSPLTEGLPGNEFKDEVKPLPGETVIKKSVNSAFIGTYLKDLLDAQEIHTVVIAGLTTQHCVSTTVRMAGNYGYETFVAADATAAFRETGPNGEVYPAELVHQVSLATMNKEFATVLTTREILEEMEARTAAGVQ
ncbi:MAG TPA: cysteine hydrolase family protein [Puia sp.]|nr:cysteine hydrolase family protein [Puia sp.]